jgi:hypothetical protein
MTQDEIMEMWNEVIKYAPSEVRITEFAKMVAQREREALCKLMEDQNTWDLYDPNATAIEIIRARGNHD